MTPAQGAMCHVLLGVMGTFYDDPENERRFQEWKERRASATDLQLHAPSACRPRKGRHTANLTASAT